VAGTLALEWVPVLQGWWPLSALLGAIGLLPARQLIRLLQEAHDQPERISDSKFLALRFQTLNGLGLAVGLALGPWLSTALG
jgi:1,4-dihydroxy-2-naphthoate octaprenyltransferase